MRNAKTLLFTLVCIGLIGVVLLTTDTREFAQDNATASVGSAKTIEQILQKRANFANRAKSRDAQRLVNILIVPGHDDEHWGTSYGKLREVELNRALAQDLYGYLVREDGINVVLASDGSGYNEIFDAYFEREREMIQKFITDTKSNFRQKIEANQLAVDEENFHNVAPENAIYRLYGINRWVNDSDFDMVIHVHFNDHARKVASKPGMYTGFSIYAPGPEFDNHELSRRLADSIFAELKKIRPVSDLPAEGGGVIEDHELIALGANASLEAGSVLVEYGYIYEGIFTNPTLREVSLDNMAYATYAGIKKMLGETPVARDTKVVAITKIRQLQPTWNGSFKKHSPDSIRRMVGV